MFVYIFYWFILMNVSVFDFTNSQSVFLGVYYSCVLISNVGGVVKCWGINDYGQIGDGTIGTNKLTPTSVSGLTLSVSAISGGYYHMCALLSTGGLLCWGSNGGGQIGDGTSGTNRLTPTSVSGLSSGVLSIGGGQDHFCAVLSTGAAKCWGSNTNSQIGDGSTTFRTTPTSVSTLSSGVSAISGGSSHTCALLTSGGVKCWGGNTYGQIGDGTSSSTDKLTPVSVSGLSGGTAVCCGAYFSCALLSTGGIKCWGRNDAGQAGDGSGTNRLTPVSVSGLTTGVSSMSCGYAHACAVLSTGTVKCWGRNDAGQVGDGTSGTNRLSPVSASGLTSTASGIGCGFKHTCVLLSTGGVQCFGNNWYGQIGDGTFSSTVNKLTPVDVYGFPLTFAPTFAPSNPPSSLPSNQPSFQPSAQPSNQPSSQPSTQPSRQPSTQPSSQPSFQPSTQPSPQPSTRPSLQPSRQPSIQPITQPSAQPSTRPSSQPTNQPSSQPSNQPSTQPSSQPSRQPSTQPSSQPSTQPNRQPSSQPSDQPSVQPTTQPSPQPSGQPSTQPSLQPSMRPTVYPSSQPLTQFSPQPLSQPSIQPSHDLSSRTPSIQPSTHPSSHPSNQPSLQPSAFPSKYPTVAPTSQPSLQPTGVPSVQPSSQPSHQPSPFPTIQPSLQPTSYPSVTPSYAPKSLPTSRPSAVLSKQPSVRPSMQPSSQPSCNPYGEPSRQPSSDLSSCLSLEPTHVPSTNPSATPSLTGTAQPSSDTSSCPSVLPSNVILLNSTRAPTYQPSLLPSIIPYVEPNTNPTMQPSIQPTEQTSEVPSMLPTVAMSAISTVIPTCCPTMLPSLYPSVIPTVAPSLSSSTVPTFESTLAPHLEPSFIPSLYPTASPLTLSIKAAYFTKNGYSVMVTLNLPLVTDALPAVFPCSHILHITNKNFGEPLLLRHQCVFADSQTIMSRDIKYFEVNKTVLSLNPFISVPMVCVATMTDCSNVVIDRSNVTLAEDRNHVYPRVMIRGSSTIGRCEDLHIDLTASTGHGGRAWRSVNITVKAGTDVSDSNVTMLTQAISDQLTTNRPFQVKRDELVSSLFPYEITFTLCNMFNHCDYGLMTVNVTNSSNSVPMIAILGESKVSIKRSSSLSLTSIASLGSCDRKNASKLVIMWQVWDITSSSLADGILQPNLVSISNDKLNFVLPSYSLSVDRVYQIKVVATDSKSGLSTFRAVTINVEASALVAVITPRRSSMTIRLGGEIVTIDGFASCDPDINPVFVNTTLPKSISFQWQCLGINPRYLSAKRGIITNAELLQSWTNRRSDIFTHCFINITNTQMGRALLSTSNESSLNTVSIVILTVRDITNDNRNSSTLVQVSVLPREASLVSITTSDETVTKFNARHRLFLTGLVYCPDTLCIVSWTVKPLLEKELRSIVVGSLSRNVVPNLWTSVNLLLASHSFANVPVSYVFTLSCDTSSSSVTVTVNGSPYGGNFEVQPSRGDELTTAFTFSASYWMDEDLPLTYQFGYLTTSAVSNLLDFTNADVELFIQSRMELSYVSSVLSCGREALDYWINTTLTVFDSYDATESSKSVVQVMPQTVSNMQKLLSEKLQLKEALSIEELKRLLTVSSSALNRINCSLAIDCDSKYNRQSCSAKDQTCGKCLLGYVGEDGDCNSMCVSANILAVTVSTTPASCEVDTDCHSWQYCNTSTYTCLDKIKACPLDCSGHGICRHYSSSTMLLVASSRCTIFMTSCEAICQCVEGFAGSDCSLSSQELESKQKLRETMIDGLSQTIATNVVDAQSIIGAASLLQSIVTKSDEVSTVAASKASTVAVALVKQATQSGMVNFRDIMSLPQALDLALTASLITSSVASTSTSSEGHTTLVSIVNAINDMGNLIFRDQTADDNATTLIYHNYRLTNDATVVINVPTTPLEQLQLANGSSSSLTALGGKKNRTAGQIQQLQTVEFTRKLWNAAASINSTEILQSKVLLVKTFNIDIVLVTINKLPDFVSAQPVMTQDVPMNFTTLCRKDTIGNFTFLCIDSGKELRHTCNGTAGILVSFCPVKTVGCNILSLADGSVQRSSSSSCVTVNSTISDVTCLCKVPQQRATYLNSGSKVGIGGSGSITSTTGGKPSSSSSSEWSTGIDIIDNSGAITIGATAYFIASDFKNTFNAAPNALSSAEDTEKVLTVILMFATVWILGFVLLVWMAYVRHRKFNKGLMKKGKLGRRETNSVIPANIERRGSAFVRRASSVVIPGSGQSVKVASINKAEKNNILEADDANVHVVNSEEDMMRERLSEYVKSVMPGVFNSSSILLSMFNEIRRHHAYFSLFWYSPTETDRLPVLIVSQLLTNMTAMMFMLALLYDLQSPSDDGRCPQYVTMESCIERKSMLDYDQSYCTWVDENTGICVFNPVEINIKIQLYCSAMVLVFTAILMHPVDILFAILASPTKQKRWDLLSSSVLVLPKIGAGITPSNVGNKGDDSESQSTAVIVLPEETQQAYRKARLSVMYLTNKQVQQLDLMQRQHSGEAKIDDVSTLIQASEAYNNPAMQLLVRDIAYTREILQRNANGKASEMPLSVITEFDRQWGIDSYSGEFVKHIQDVTNGSWFEELIMQELDRVQEVVKTLQASFRYKSEAQAGVELLQLFIQDLLGRDTDAAKLFRLKVDEDYASYEMVSIWQKVAAGTAVIVVNLFFLYYSILKGYQKGISWQRAFLFACVMQIVFDVLLSQTIQCLYINYFLPRMMSKASIDRVRHVLHDCIEHLCTHRSSFDDRSFPYRSHVLDAPSYLFVSTQIANSYPSMMESMMVLSYHTIFPGEIGKKWHEMYQDALHKKENKSRHLDWSDNVADKFDIQRLVTILNTLLIISIVKFMTMTPVPLQKLLISFVEPIVLGGLALVWYYVVSSWIGIFLFCMFVVSVCGKMAYNHYRAIIKDTTTVVTSVQEENGEYIYGARHVTTMAIVSLLEEEEKVVVQSNTSSFSLSTENSTTIKPKTNDLNDSSSLSTSFNLSSSDQHSISISTHESKHIAEMFKDDYDYHDVSIDIHPCDDNNEEDSIPHHWFYNDNNEEVSEFDEEDIIMSSSSSGVSSCVDSESLNDQDSESLVLSINSSNVS